MENTGKSSQHKITVTLVLANMLVLTLHAGWVHASSSASSKAGGGGTPISAQGGGRRIIRESAHNKEPVEIGDVKFKGKAIKFGEEIDGDETWLRDVSVRVKNVSDKTITYLRLDFVFPDPIRPGAVNTQNVFLGRRYDVPMTSRNEPLRLEPGESATVSLAAHFDEIKSLVEPRYGAVGNVRQVAVNLADALFEDGTLYSGGAVFRRNPDESSPRTWLIIRDQQ
ncbi:MAG TPA: hypothetical protein VK421_03655 [Pyrinomonadaceae bacterium]|nr:hypothetical protein [Pyrinomonadaceae bacterium]